MGNNKIIKYEDSSMLRVSKMLAVTNKILKLNFRKRNIVHLDDHVLFLKGVETCISPNMPNWQLVQFQYPEKALEHISNSLTNNTIIDLIITDFNHMDKGINGYDFAKAVKDIEIKHGKKIPILLLSMMSNSPIALKGIEENVFDKCLGKNSNSEVIIEAIKSLFLD